MKLLFGTNAYNPHAVHIARALQESQVLAAYETGGVDNWRTPWSRSLRGLVGRMPSLDRELRKRRVEGLDPALVRAHWAWEALRVVSARGHLGARATDWLWERGELALDRLCARRLEDPEVDGFIGVEHGALSALTAARALGKPAGLVFMSPHHSAYARWVAPEFEVFPELKNDAQAHLATLAIARDRRRDDEAGLADCIFSNSSFTTRSLVDAGIEASRIVTVGLGCEPAPAGLDVPEPELRTGPVRMMFAGPLSVRKGGHHLLAAWPLIGGDAELHCYGSLQLPERLVAQAVSAQGGNRLHLHGSVDGATLRRAYRNADVLVLPTLCDGFGLVITEALSMGLPVITTTNAGAADLITEGENGFVIPPANREALVNALSWAVSHPADLRAMRPAAARTARAHGWDQFRLAFAGHVQQRFQPALGHRSADAS